ncbi:MAG TPA: hypothetical protein VG204_18305 [Terriglobia bacterium]|nr:hypothetical protein [Terriglobia bacterium]
MVGHTGKLDAAIKAVEAADACLGEIEQAVRPRGGAMIVTADDGNAELIVDPATGGPHTAHTTNPVPFIVVADPRPTRLARGRRARRRRPHAARRHGDSPAARG